MSLPVIFIVEGYSAWFECPGCEMGHAVNVAPGHGPVWGWNGSLDRPTFTPSVLATGVHRLNEDERDRRERGESVEPRPLRCHSFVRDGRIEFLSDCTHHLAGQTIPLPAVDR